MKGFIFLWALFIFNSCSLKEEGEFINAQQLNWNQYRGKTIKFCECDNDILLIIFEDNTKVAISNGEKLVAYDYTW